MRQVAATLWIGNAFEARDMTKILSAGLQAIVDLAKISASGSSDVPPGLLSDVRAVIPFDQ